MAERLRLMAEDAADLDVLAAAVQDAIGRVGDLSYDAKARRFSAMVNRFRWESADGEGPFERVRAAISFESVLGVKSRKLRIDAPNALGSILAINFDAAEE